MDAVRGLADVITLPAPGPGFIGEGHTAVHVMEGREFARTDPFIMLADDRVDLPPGTRAGGPHPHAGFEIEKTLWLNAVGIVGWFANSRILKHETIPRRHIRVFERLVPLARALDSVATSLVGGLSLICIARRPAGASAMMSSSPQGTMAVPR